MVPPYPYFEYAVYFWVYPVFHVSVLYSKLLRYR